VQYEVEIGGRIRHVRVNRENGLFLVDVDGRRWHVDAARLDAQRLSLLIAAVRSETDSDPASRSAAPASIEVALAPNGAPGQMTVQVGAATVHAAVNGRRWRRSDDHTGHTSGPQRVIAPMPGKVVRVLVSAGQTIAARQPIVVVEAMKMENELRAPRAGVVKDLKAKEGAAVDGGAVLCVVE